MAQLYKDFGTWMSERLPFKVQKLSIDAGFSCPNRDGRIGYGGCTFCDNRTFSLPYCDSKKSIVQQLEEGKRFFHERYSAMKYLAYFQAYTNTYAPLDTLKTLYETALQVKDVVGIIIGTRPDCVSDSLFDYLEQLARQVFVMVEFGVESANDATLKRINRGHDFACSRKAIEECHSRGIYTGAHIILGLPGEDKDEVIRQASLISALPIDVLKIHQLQIIRGTKLAVEYERSPFRLYTANEYIELIIRYISHLRKDLVLDRFVSQSPKELLVAPKWNLKNHEFMYLLQQRMQQQLGISIKV